MCPIEALLAGPMKSMRWSFEGRFLIANGRKRMKIGTSLMLTPTLAPLILPIRKIFKCTVDKAAIKLQLSIHFLMSVSKGTADRMFLEQGIPVTPLSQLNEEKLFKTVTRIKCNLLVRNSNGFKTV